MSVKTTKSRRRASAAPVWLKTAPARKLFDKLRGELGSLRFVQDTDEAGLARYCQYLSEWIRLTRKLETEGETFTTSSEHVKDWVRLRPEVRLRDRAETHLQSLEDRLGLNPKFRFELTSRLLSQKAPTKPGELPLDDPDRASHHDEWDAILGTSRAN